MCIYVPENGRNQSAFRQSIVRVQKNESFRCFATLGIHLTLGRCKSQESFVLETPHGFLLTSLKKVTSFFTQTRMTEMKMGQVVL